MGPYCQFCDFRCFVVRRLPFTTGDFLMATCQRGMAHDRAQTGHDHTTAINPAALRDAVVPDSRDLEQARSIACRLEGQVAGLVDRMRRAHSLLGEVGGCFCVGDAIDRPVCAWCQVRGLLSTELLDPAGTDRLLDALAEVAGS